MTPKSYKIMIIAGESSGDGHAAHLVSQLRDRSEGTELQFFGATGPKMREAGVDTGVSSDDFAVVGVLEILTALPRFLSAFESLTKAAESRRPDIVVLVDFPEFNMKFAKRMKRLGVPVVYFISPQLWAWRKYRLRGMKRDVDMLLSIFPFEKKWYRDNGYENVFYVGNPTSDRLAHRGTETGFGSHIALLPGSRRTEIRKILPIMLEAGKMISSRMPNTRIRIPAASEIAETEIKSIVEHFVREEMVDPKLFSVEMDAFEEIVGEAKVAAVASGTATLETALLGTPLVVVYKSSLINYLLLRPLISVPFFSLVNLIAEKRLATELIQFDFTAERLTEELLSIMAEKRNEEFRAELRMVRKRLSGAEDGKDAADRLLDFMGSRSPVKTNAI